MVVGTCKCSIGELRAYSTVLVADDSLSRSELNNYAEGLFSGVFTRGQCPIGAGSAFSAK